jgi:hypothetical protein
MAQQPRVPVNAENEKRVLMGAFQFMPADLLNHFITKFFSPRQAVGLFGRLSKGFEKIIDSAAFYQGATRNYFHKKRAWMQTENVDEEFKTMQKHWTDMKMTNKPRGEPVSSYTVWKYLFNKQFRESCYECGRSVPHVYSGQGGQKHRLYRHPFTHRHICTECLTNSPNYIMLNWADVKKWSGLRRRQLDQLTRKRIKYYMANTGTLIPVIMDLVRLTEVMFVFYSEYNRLDLYEERVLINADNFKNFVELNKESFAGILHEYTNL